MRIIQLWSLVFFMLAAAGYLIGSRRLFSLIGILLGASAPLLVIIFHVETFPVVLSLAITGLLLYGISRSRFDSDAIEKRLSLEEKALRDTRNTYQAEHARLKIIDEDAKAKELSIFNLYEFTKKLSHSLKFEEIFSEFVSFLGDRFSFTRSELIILKYENRDLRVDRVYELWGSRGTAEKTPKQPHGERGKSLIDCEELVKVLPDGSEELFMARDEDKTLFKRLRFSDEVETFVAVPLKSEKRIVALLIVENLSKSEVDDFTILSAQFALELKKVLLYETVESLAITDGLTMLYSRRYFLERLEEELRRSVRQRLSFSFLMADIDYFKQCNDTYGHLVGDVALKEIARLIKSTVREIDLVSRYGGEEFSILLPETGKEGAMRVAERLRRRIEHSIIKAYDESLKLTISIGISCFPSDAKDSNTLIDKADTALYEAKRSGRDRVCPYAP